MSVPAIRIDAPGAFASVQDLGRAHQASRGIARSGALDRTSLRAGNRALGNPEQAAGIEIALGGLRATALTACRFAVTGAAAPLLLDGHPVDPYAVREWPAGSVLEIGAVTQGVRCYLTVRGGIDVPLVAGSRSTDTLSGIGPAPLRAGEEVPIGEPAEQLLPAEFTAWAPSTTEVELELEPGPRADWFVRPQELFEHVWTVSQASDRIGVRLEGPALERIHSQELPSEPMVPGAIQVPPGGQPTVLLADGPVTGGYPVIAVVADADLGLLGQAHPGSQVRFRHARP